MTTAITSSRVLPKTISVGMLMRSLKRVSAFLPFALLACASSPKTHICEASPVLFENFEQASSSTVKALSRDPNYTLGRDTENNYLVSIFVSNEVGSERNTRRLKLPPMQAATLNFDIWFEPDFDFVLGGKLPGFAPDTPAWGGESVEPNEWSNRIMWRKGGEPITYSYHQNKPHKWGDDSDPVGETSYMPVGQWLSLSLVTELGTGRKDGFTEVWMNGRKVSERREMDFHAMGEDAPISTLAFHSFFGGNTPKWAPRDINGNYKNLVAHFDNLSVQKGHCVRNAPLRRQ